MGVLAIWRYPIKAMLGEALAAARVTRGGIPGDRRWVVVDRRTGERIANKRGPTDPRLRACRASLGDGDRLRVTLPGGEAAADDEIPDALSDLLERPVALERGEHHDFAPLHLLAERTLARLREDEPASDWSARRFRANLLLDGGPPAGDFAEDGLVGSELRGAGGLRLHVAIATPRCVVPTRASEDLPADPGLLRTLARRHMVDLGRYGRGVCLGAYADVRAAGALVTGERLEVVA